MFNRNVLAAIVLSSKHIDVLSALKTFIKDKK